MAYQTHQRTLVLNLLKEKHEYSLSAGDIRKLIPEEAISKATLYRTLDLLASEKVIKKFYNEQTGSFEYQYTEDENCSHHFHLKCMQCGKLIHLHCSSCDSFINHLADTHDFTPKEGLTVIYGVCKECSLLRRH